MLKRMAKLLAKRSPCFSPTQAGPTVNSSLLTCTLGQVTQKAWSCDWESLYLWLFNSVYSKVSRMWEERSSWLVGR